MQIGNTQLAAGCKSRLLEVGDRVDLIKEFLDSSKSVGKINSTTLEIYRKDIEDFDGFIVGKELIDATRDDIVRYIAELKKRYSDRSVYRKLSSVKSFYRYLCENRIIDSSPANDVELPNKVKQETQPLEKWEIKGILDACGDSYEERRDSLIVRILCETGLKIGDVLGLEKEALELADYKTINLYKNSRFINEPLSDKLASDLKEFSTGIFEKTYPGRNGLFLELTRQSFRVRFKIYAKKAELRREVSPSMIKKMIIEEKLKDEDGNTLLDKIRAEYMRIGIGDD